MRPAYDDSWSPLSQVQAPPVVPAIPTPPAVPEVASGGAADVAQCAAEQSFAELGLGSYTPVGLIQNLLEFMHVDLGLPWWGAIATCKMHPEEGRGMGAEPQRWQLSVG